MTNLKKLTLIALLSASPVAVFAEIKTGSPQQAVDVDPNEDVALKPVTGESMEDTAKTDQGENAYDDAEIAEELDGSLIEEDAKADG